MTFPIKTAVIGAGNMGKNHIRIYAQHSNLVGICDLDIALANQLAMQYKTHSYANYLDLLKEEKPEAVSIAAPTEWHYQIAKDCLEAGVSVLLEKPIAPTLDQAEALLALAREKQLVFMVGHIERFNPVVVAIKQLVLSGELGRLVSLVAIRAGRVPPKIPQSNVVLDLAIHDIDIFNFLLDERPISVVTKSQRIYPVNIADSAGILLEYQKATGLIQTNWLTPVKMRQIFVTGTKGFIQADYINQELALWEQVVADRPERDFHDFVSLYQSPRKEIKIEKAEPLLKEIQFFLNKVKLQELIDSTYALDALKAVLC